jgi:hypothetical protein
METILRQIHDISETIVYLNSYRFSHNSSRLSYHATIERKTDSSKVEVRKISDVSMADALELAWDEFQSIVGYGIPKATLYPNLLEAQASAQPEEF